MYDSGDQLCCVVRMICGMSVGDLILCDAYASMLKEKLGKGKKAWKKNEKRCDKQKEGEDEVDPSPHSLSVS